MNYATRRHALLSRRSDARYNARQERRGWHARLVAAAAEKSIPAVFVPLPPMGAVAQPRLGSPWQSPVVNVVRDTKPHARLRKELRS